MATFSSLFVFSKNVITKIRKACLKQQVFLLWVYFPLLLLDVVNRGLELSEERKLNAFITDYIDSRFIIYKSARYVLLFSIEGNVGENLCFAFGLCHK